MHLRWTKHLSILMTNTFVRRICWWNYSWKRKDFTTNETTTTKTARGFTGQSTGGGDPWMEVCPSIFDLLEQAPSFFRIYSRKEGQSWCGRLKFRDRNFPQDPRKRGFKQFNRSNRGFSIWANFFWQGTLVQCTEKTNYGAVLECKDFEKG